MAAARIEVLLWLQEVAMYLPTALEFAEQATQHLAAIQQVVLVTCSPINLIFLSDESIMFT
jgi:hypothetical protein